MRLSRPLLLLALAALLAPRAEASRTSVWGPNPSSSLTATRADAAGLLASRAPAAPLETSPLANAEAAVPQHYNLGDIVLADIADTDAEHLTLGRLTFVDLNLLRGPPPSYPETRVGGFELLPPFRVGASPTLSLWSRQACGFSCREVASDSRYDPWGLCAFGLPCPGIVEVGLDATWNNLKAAAGMALGAADMASGGRITGASRAVAAAANSEGTATERLASAYGAYESGKRAVTSLGFSEAKDKGQHLRDVTGVSGVDRGTARMFNAVVDRDPTEFLYGYSDYMGGVGQLSGTAATLYAPFAPKAAAPRPKNVFPENPTQLSEQIGAPKISVTKDGTPRLEWNPNSDTRIRFESHPEGLKPGDAGYNPRHHGPHYHVETKPSGQTWNQAKKAGVVTKAKPEGYTPGSGTGFVPGEKFPGSN